MEHMEDKRRIFSLPDTERHLSADLPKHVVERINRYFSAHELGIEKISKTWSSVSEHPLLWLKLEFRGDGTPSDVICDIIRNVHMYLNLSLSVYMALKDIYYYLRCLFVLNIKSPLLESLQLINVPDVVSILRQACRCCRQLKCLTVRFCHTGEDPSNQVSVPESALRNVISSCPNLSYLDLKGTPFFGRLFYRELVHLRKLHALRLGYNRLLHPKDIFSIVGACRGRLTHFSLVQSIHGPPPCVRPYGSEPLKSSRRTNRDRLLVLHDHSYETAEAAPHPLTSRECAFLVEMLGTELIALELDAGAVDGRVFRLLSSRCPNLRSLRLYNAVNLPGDVVRRIPSAMPCLAHLTLRNAYLASSEDLLSLVRWCEAEDLPPLPDWRSMSDSLPSVAAEEEEEAENVELVDCWWEDGFASEGDESQVDSLGTNSQGQADSRVRVPHKDLTSLHTLELTMCPSVNDSVLYMLSLNSRTGGLQRLGLRGCQQITDNGLEFLKKCSKLKYLDVSYVNSMRGPSSKWLKSIPQDLPNLITLIVGFLNKDIERETAITDLIETNPMLHIKKRLSLYHSKELILS